MAKIDTDTTARFWETATLIAAPVLLFAALLAHPYIGGRLPNDEAIAEEVAAGMTRWALAHVATGLASALIILAFLVVRGYLRRAGEDRFSAIGMPFVIIGSTLFAFLPGMEFVPLAVAETGGTTAEIAAAQESVEGWFIAILLVGALTFAIGMFSFARAISITSVGGPGLAGVVVAGLVVMAVSRFVPFAAVQFYVQGIATSVALLPLAYVVWTTSDPPSAGLAQV